MQTAWTGLLHLKWVELPKKVLFNAFFSENAGTCVKPYVSTNYTPASGCQVDTGSLNMSYTESDRAAEQNGVSAEVSTSTVVMTTRSEANSWKRRHQRKKRLRLEGWPPRVAIPRELLDQREKSDANGKEDGEPDGSPS